MGLFKRKERTSVPPPRPPEIPLDLPTDGSIMQLAAKNKYGVVGEANMPTPAAPVSAAAAIASEYRSGATRQMSSSQSRQTPSAALPGARHNPVASNSSTAVRSSGHESALSASSSMAMPPSNRPPTAGGQSELGHHAQQPSLSRSMSHGAVPYHLPWTRNLKHDESGGMDGLVAPMEQGEAGDMERTKSAGGQGTVPRRRATGVTQPPPSAALNPQGLATLFQRPTDFRVSPNSIPQPTPSQRRHVIDAARGISLRRAKAAAELNLMLMGATGTGKTSFARTLLSTCDLSLCSEEAKRAAAYFGIAPDPSHPTHETDPITPLRTRQYDVLQGIELQAGSLVPIAALESGVDPSHRLQNGRNRPYSTVSTRVSHSNAHGHGRVQMSLCDTPGFDFDVEDELEIERKLAMALRYLETRLAKTLSEESKVQRQPRGDGLVHLILYFIDPRMLVERVERRRERRDRARYSAVRPTSTDAPRQQRARSMSLSASSAAKAAALANGTVSKQAQTAQLRQSMETVHARQGKRPGSKGSVSIVDMPNSRSAPNGLDPDSAIVEEDMDALEDDDEADMPGLTRQQLSIIARLSEKANVLPIIAKADTLTQAQLDEVRAAVRQSLVKANIDLGAFEVEGARRRRASKGQGNATHTNKGTASADTAAEAADHTPETSEDTPLTRDPVKVIRIRSRRSYSLTGRDRVGASTSGHSLAGHSDAMGSEIGDGQSLLGHTAPLFDGSSHALGQEGEDDDEEAEEEAWLSTEQLAKLVPLTLFVPEPIRIQVKRPTRPAGPSRQGSMNSLAEHLPPVPKLPEGVNGIRATSLSRPGTGTSAQQVTVNGQEEAEELLDPDLGGATQAQSECSPALNGASIHGGRNGEGVAQPSTSPTKQAALSLQPPPPSRRFQRHFRFGHANVLDARQCDFGLLRTCILASHTDRIREQTDRRYERFRSQRLETRMKLLNKSSSNPALSQHLEA